MGREEREQKLDEFLDRALSEYSAVEPQWGFEQRILAKIRAADEPRPRWVKFWAPIFAVVTVAAVVAVMLMPRANDVIESPGRNTTASSTTTPSIVTPSAVEPSRGVKVEARKFGSKPRGAARVQKPVEQPAREAVFPSPAPLTREEKALIALMKNAPREAEIVSNAAKEQTQLPQKLTIQAINIEPLEAGGFGGGR